MHAIKKYEGLSFWVEISKEGCVGICYAFIFKDNKSNVESNTPFPFPLSSDNPGRQKKH